MSDIFDHPDLRDPSWSRKLKKETRRSFWRRNRRKLTVLSGIAVVVAAVAGFNAFRSVEQPVVVTVSASTAPTTPTTMETGVKVDLTQPFVGTPAAGWSDGEAGVVVPPAQPVNGFTAAQVTAAMTKVRQAFVTANLDRAVIQDGNVEPLVALFAKDVQDAIRTEPGYRVRIAPGFRLLPVPPKVNGTLTAEAGQKGEIVVRVNFAVAYAFHIDDPGQILDVMDIVTVQRTDMRYVLRDGPSFAATSHGLWPAEGRTFVYAINCSAADQGLMAPKYSERQFGVGATGDIKDKVFDPNAPLPEGSTC